MRDEAPCERNHRSLASLRSTSTGQERTGGHPEVVVLGDRDHPHLRREVCEEDLQLGALERLGFSYVRWLLCQVLVGAGEGAQHSRRRDHRAMRGYIHAKLSRVQIAIDHCTQVWERSDQEIKKGHYLARCLRQI